MEMSHGDAVIIDPANGLCIGVYRTHREALDAAMAIAVESGGTLYIARIVANCSGEPKS